MRKLIKQASRQNLPFIILSWFVGLWGLVTAVLVWPKINWQNMEVVTYALIGVALFMLIGAFFQNHVKDLNARKRLLRQIICRQLQLMSTFLLIEAAILTFIVFINHALAL